MHTPLPSTLGAFLREILRPYRWRIAFVCLCPIALSLENNALPYALKLVVDAVMEHQGPRADIWPKVTGAILLYVGVLSAMMALFRVREWVMITLQPKIQAEIRERLFLHTMLHSHRYFSDNFAGSIAAKVNDLARSVNAMKDFICWRLITSVSVNIIAVALISTVHWAFGALVGGWIVLHLSLSRYFGVRVGAFAARNAEDRARLSGAIVDSIGNVSTVRAFARRAHERDTLREVQAVEVASQRAMLKRIWWSRLITDLPMCVMYLALFTGLVYGWQREWVSAGDMVYVLFATFLVLEQTWMLGTDFPGFISELGSARNALSLIATPVEIDDTPDAKPLQVTQGEIRYENIIFGYHAGKGTQTLSFLRKQESPAQHAYGSKEIPAFAGMTKKKADMPLFDGLSLSIAPGEKLGLVGFSGSGKTSFVNLLMRLHELQAGRITIDGQDIAQATQESLRRAIGVIPQETSLFHRSLRDNIAYGNPEASEDTIREAARRAGCEGFIAALPEGLDTLVGERGVKLSGGQRQRIALARAMVKDAPILVLDEATSALDSVTESIIATALSDMMKGKTVLVIAHRLSTLAQMDRILVFDQGRIIEEGTHDSLRALGGRYATMWHMQAGGFLPEKDAAREGDVADI